MRNYKRINQKSLAFHAEAKQKNYKEEKKLRKPYEALPFLLEACVFLQAFRLQGSWENIIVYILLTVSNFPEFLYFAEDLLPILFLRYCRFYFLFLVLKICFLFWFKKATWTFAYLAYSQRQMLKIIYPKNTKITKDNN